MPPSRAVEKGDKPPRRWPTNDDQTEENLKRNDPKRTPLPSKAPAACHEGIPPPSSAIYPNPQQSTPVKYGVGGYMKYGLYYPATVNRRYARYARYYAVYGPEHMSGPWLAMYGRMREAAPNIYCNRAVSDQQARALLRAHGHYGAAERPLRRMY